MPHGNDCRRTKNRGVEDKDIIYLDLDKRGNRSIKTPEQLEKKIESLLADNDFKYLFIDEVQTSETTRRS